MGAPVFHQVAVLGDDAGDNAVKICCDLVHHLHGLHDAEGLALLHPVPHLDKGCCSRSRCRVKDAATTGAVTTSSPAPGAVGVSGRTGASSPAASASGLGISGSSGSRRRIGSSRCWGWASVCSLDRTSENGPSSSSRRQMFMPSNVSISSGFLQVSCVFRLSSSHSTGRFRQTI